MKLSHFEPEPGCKAVCATWKFYLLYVGQWYNLLNLNARNHSSHFSFLTQLPPFTNGHTPHFLGITFPCLSQTRWGWAGNGPMFIMVGEEPSVEEALYATKIQKPKTNIRKPFPNSTPELVFEVWNPTIIILPVRTSIAHCIFLALGIMWGFEGLF